MHGGDDPLVPGPLRDVAVRRMFDRIAGRYDLVNRIMTGGLDEHWRRRTVDALALEPGAVVVDVACGTGRLCRHLEAAGHRAVGVDLSEAMLRAGGADLHLVLGDGLRLPLADAAADGTTFGFALRNVTDQPRLFAELARVLRPGGRMALLEMAAPRWQPARAVHRLYVRRVVPLVGSVLSERQAYEYLPRSAAFLPPAGRLTAMVSDAGFVAVRHRLLGLGAAQLLDATRA